MLSHGLMATPDLEDHLGECDSLVNVKIEMFTLSGLQKFQTQSTSFISSTRLTRAAPCEAVSVRVHTSYNIM